ncbi:hypothetical protein RJ641_014800 [Dillenia turbinata]|uniref:Uncharacterized protein n=1 Tax=Dillenia turbinata TaxID=194707 RepID=A0AAN8Z1N4_9MAGN
MTSTQNKDSLAQISQTSFSHTTQNAKLEKNAIMLHLNGVVDTHPAILAIGLFICAAAALALGAFHVKKRRAKEPNNSSIGQSIRTLLRSLAGIKSIYRFKSRKTGGALERLGSGGVWQKQILMGDKCEPLDFSGVIHYDGNGKQLSEPPMRSPKPKPEGFGSGGVWQKQILMGDKCEPLDFSGVIHYDGTGKQLSEPPMKSPKPSYVTRREEIEQKV